MKYRNLYALILVASLAACGRIVQLRPPTTVDTVAAYRPASTGSREPRSENLPPVPALPNAEAEELPGMWLATSDGMAPFQVESVQADESVSRPWNVWVWIAVPGTLDVGAWTGRHVTVAARLRTGEFRYFNGYAAEIRDEGRDVEEGVTRYQIRLQSWLSQLGQTTSCEAYENLTTPEIAYRMFQKYDAASYEFRLKHSYPVRPVVLQYEENDLQFLRRLLEQDGIYYYFVHAPQGHKLVLVDTVDMLRPMADNDVFAYRPTADEFADMTEQFGHDRVLREWKSAPGSLSESDQDRWGPWEAFYSRIRGEETDSRQRRMRGTTPFGMAQIGRTFVVTGDTRATGRFMVARTVMSMASEDFEVLLSAVPVGASFRPRRRLERPTVDTNMSAEVIGPAEGGTDLLGRIKVRFDWSQANCEVNRDTAWVHLQAATETARAVPPMGSNTVITFVDNDPDQPRAFRVETP